MKRIKKLKDFYTHRSEYYKKYKTDILRSIRFSSIVSQFTIYTYISINMLGYLATILITIIELYVFYSIFFNESIIVNDIV